MNTNTIEQWVPIEGFPHYKVSNHGRVWSDYSHRYIGGNPKSDRAPSVYLRKNGFDYKGKAISVLVCEHFHPDYKEGVRIKYIDGNRSNNHIDNLDLIDWISKEPRETNVEYRPWAMRARVVEWDRTFTTVRELADEIGGDLSSVYRVLRGQQKTHLGLTFERVD